MPSDRDRIQRSILEYIPGLIWIYNHCSVIDERAWDVVYDIIFLDPVTTHHFSQFQLMWPHRSSRSSPFREWWAAFHSYMGQLFDKTLDQMNNWRWDNPCAFRNQVDCSNPETTSMGKVNRPSDRLVWYGGDEPRAEIEPPSCQQYELGDFLAITPHNWDETLDEDDDDEDWADTGVPSGGSSRPGDGNCNDDSEGEEDMQGSENGNGKGKGTMEGKGKGKATEHRRGKGKWKGTRNGKGKGNVKHTAEGDDMSPAIALQLQNEMSEVDLDTER